MPPPRLKSVMFGSRPSGNTATFTPVPSASVCAASAPLPKSTFIDWSASGSRRGAAGLEGHSSAGVPEPTVLEEAWVELVDPALAGAATICGVEGAAWTWTSGTTARTAGSCCRRADSALEMVAETALTNAYECRLPARS